MFYRRNVVVNKVNLADIKNEIISLRIYELDSFVRVYVACEKLNQLKM